MAFAISTIPYHDTALLQRWLPIAQMHINVEENKMKFYTITLHYIMYPLTTVMFRWKHIEEQALNLYNTVLSTRNLHALTVAAENLHYIYDATAISAHLYTNYR